MAVTTQNVLWRLFASSIVVLYVCFFLCPLSERCSFYILISENATNYKIWQDTRSPEVPQIYMRFYMLNITNAHAVCSSPNQHFLLLLLIVFKPDFIFL